MISASIRFSCAFNRPANALLRERKHFLQTKLCCSMRVKACLSAWQPQCSHKCTWYFIFLQSAKAKAMKRSKVTATFAVLHEKWKEEIERKKNCVFPSAAAVDTHIRNISKSSQMKTKVLLFDLLAPHERFCLIVYAASAAAATDWSTARSLDLDLTLAQTILLAMLSAPNSLIIIFFTACFSLACYYLSYKSEQRRGCFDHLPSTLQSDRTCAQQKTQHKQLKISEPVNFTKTQPKENRTDFRL